MSNNGMYGFSVDRIRVKALGGNTVKDIGGFRIHTFLSSGYFIVQKEGLIDVLLVAGGGGGGSPGYAPSGGGGGGGVLYVTDYYILVGNHYITVGAGGPAGNWSQAASWQTNGGESKLDGLIAIGGGAGATGVSPSPTTRGGMTGGSGGGGGPHQCRGEGITGQGYPGCVGNGMGGGGAGAAATNVNGGAGKAYDISGTLTYYGGGGSGGNSAGSGGLGGGGARQVAGTPNTGGGGGGGPQSTYGASGGSGIVIIRYRL